MSKKIKSIIYQGQEYSLGNNIIQGGGDVDLTGYATEEYVNDAIANIEAPDVDLNGYYTKTEVDGLIDNIETGATAEVINQIQSDVSNLKSINHANYAVKTEVASEFSNYYNKTEVEQLISDAAAGEVDLTNYATKTYVNEQVSAQLQTALVDMDNLLNEINGENI